MFSLKKNRSTASTPLMGATDDSDHEDGSPVTQDSSSSHAPLSDPLDPESSGESERRSVKRTLPSVYLGDNGYEPFSNEESPDPPTPPLSGSASGGGARKKKSFKQVLSAVFSRKNTGEMFSDDDSSDAPKS